MLQAILSFADEARGMAQAAFVGKYPDPVLVIEPFKGEDDSGVQFETVAAGGAGGGVSGTISVAPIRKRAGANAFMQMITIGRAGNNDLELKAKGVSKFHAYITKEGDGRLLLVDADSSNGTFVDGKRLQANHDKVELKDGVPVRLGTVDATFYSPDGFYQVLRDARDPG